MLVNTRIDERAMAGLGIGLASVLIMNNHLGSLVRIPMALQRTETLELETRFPHSIAKPR